MNAVTRGADWARETLPGRMLWQPLGISLSLWARVGWIAPWFVALLPYGPEGRAPHPALFLIAAALLGHLSAWLVSALDSPSLMATAVRLVVLLTALGVGLWAYVVMPFGSHGPRAVAEEARWQAMWVAALGIGLAWWRGSRVSASESLDPEATQRSLLVGMLMVASAMVVFPAGATQGASSFLPAYIGGGLAGVVFGQIHDASRRRGGRPLPFRVPWYGVVLAGVIAVVLLGIAAGSALNAGPVWDLASFVARLLAGVVKFLGRLLAPLIELLLRLLGPVFEAWIEWLQSLMQGAEATRIAPPEPPSLGGIEGAATGSRSQVLVTLGAVLRVLLGVAGVAALLWMALRTTRRSRLEAEQVPPDSVESLTGVGAAARGTGLRGLRSALRFPSRARALYHALIVRRVYAQFLEWAAREGRPRRSAETPLEFGAAWAVRRPDLQADLEGITQAYLQVRYGERPEDRVMVDAVVASWRRVRLSPPSTEWENSL